MFLERREVSRKTPGDGKLEITTSVAERLGPPPAELDLLVDGEHGRAALVALTCSCSRGSDAGHVHYFLESPLFRTLRAGSEVSIALREEPRSIVVRRE